MLKALSRADGLVTLITLVGTSRFGCRAWRNPFNARMLRVVNRPMLTLLTLIVSSRQEKGRRKTEG